jgi:hypothetical protein
MFCPSCGEQNSLEQKFCRKCGINLEQTAMSVREQVDALGVTKQAHALEKFGSVAFGGLGVVIGLGTLGIIYAILENMVLSGRRPYAGLLLVAFVIFAALSLTYVFWNEMLKDKRRKLEQNAAPEPEIPRSTGKLSDGATFERVPSVTERTTSLLETPASKAK